MNKKYKPKKENKKRVTPKANNYKMNKTVGQAKTKCRFCRQSVPLSQAWSHAGCDGYGSRHKSAIDAAMNIQIQEMQESLPDVQETVTDGDT